MRKLALVLATTAAFGFAAPAFALDNNAKVKAGTPAAQADINANTKVKAKAKVVHHRRGVNKMVRHDRGLHRGFKHSRHLGYAKAHPKVHAKVIKPKAKAETTGARSSQ